MSPAFRTLPLSLLLLVHLHILHYPHANEPQYDNNLFDNRLKGLKSRIKMMEDICYFLVGQLEPSARNTLPTYPCSQPSDSLAFRTSLFKYLEMLRHRALLGSSQKTFINASSAYKSQGGMEGGVQTRGTSWWWKDVMVRKSLLEECTGERFECLLVAFSTYVLLHKSRPYTQDQLYALLATASGSYNDILLRCQSSRRMWLQKASLLSRRREKLEAIKHTTSIRRENTTHTNGLIHVFTLAKLKYTDLQTQLWPGEQGSDALAYVLQLAGLTVPGNAISLSYESSERHTGTFGICWVSLARPPILPLAAARHPTELKKLQCPVVGPARTVRRSEGKSSTSAQLCFLDDLASIKMSHRRLSEATLQAQDKRRMISRPTRRKQVEVRFRMVKMADTGKFLSKPIVDRTLLMRLSHHDLFAEETFQQKIDHIRQHILPSYTSPSDSSAPHTMASESGAPAPHIPRNEPVTGIRSRSTCVNSNIQIPKGLRMNEKTTVRASVARNTVHHALDRNKQLFEDEASKIIEATEDNSAGDVGLKTSKAREVPNRLWTSGQKNRTGPTSRRSIDMTLPEPHTKLPPFSTSFTGSATLLDDGTEGAEVGSVSLEEDSASEDVELSQTSMTLR